MYPKLLRQHSQGRLYVILAPFLPMEYVSFVFPTGTAHDMPGKGGLAHFFEHIYGIRTPRFPERAELAQEAEKDGIQFNALTGILETTYFHESRPDHTLASFRLLLEKVKNSRIHEKDISEEKTVILEELSDSQADPQYQAYEKLRAVLWADSSLGNESLGTSQSLNSISDSDIAAFQKENYSFDKAICIAVVRTETQAQALQKEASQLEGVSLSGSHRLSFVKKPLPTGAIPELGKRALSALGFRFKADDYVRTSAVMKLLSFYVANTLSSQLVNRLRLERKIVYWVYADFDFFHDEALWYVYATSQKEYAAEIAKAYDEELDKIAAGTIDERIFRSARETAKTDLARSLTNIDMLVEFYSKQILDRKVEISDYEEYADMLSRISSSDLAGFVRENFRKEKSARLILPA